MSAETNAQPSSGLMLAQAGTHGETVAETVQGTADHGEAGGLPPFLRFDPGVWIWTMVCFVLLLLILRKMAWKPIIASIEERDKTIKDSLNQAAKIQAESQRIADEQAKILAAARSEAQAMLASTRQAGEDLRKRLEQSANEEKARILASAHTEIESQKRAAIADLRKTTADLSIRIAEKLIQGSLDEAKQRALVDQLINEVSAAGAAPGRA